MTTLLNTKITYLPNVDRPSKFETVSLGSALCAISKDTFKEQIEAVRIVLLTSGDNAYREIKKTLPSYCFNGIFKNKLNNANFLESSGLFVIDIDHLDSKQLKATRDLLKDDPHIVFSYVSPSGNGLKAAVLVDRARIRNDADFKVVFEQIKAYWAAKGVTLDETGKDIRRLSFVSWDEDLTAYTNLKAQVFPLEEAQETKPPPAPADTPDYSPITEEDSHAEPLPDISLADAEKYLPATFGDRQDWLNIGAALHHQFSGSDEALVLFDSWSQQVAGYTTFESVKAAWASFKRLKGGKLRTFRSLIKTYNDAHPSRWRDELDAHVERFNKTHSSVVIGGKHKIMRKTSCGNVAYEYFNRKDLELLYDHTCIKIAEKINANFSIREIYANHFLAWAKHPKAKTYTAGAGFLPGQATPKDYYNTWQGFAVEPRQNDTLLKSIHYHLEHVICGGNAELYNYLLKWIAYTVQKPEKPVGTAIVLRSEKGTGKGTLGHFLRRIWGAHGLHISHAKYLIGNFNAHLAEVCFLFADEAFYSGDQKHEGVLKALITEPTLTIERKGIDAVSQPNYLKILLTANSDYVVPASRDERRYCVFDVSSDRIGDTAYFDTLHAACDSTEVQAAFLYEMLNLDLTDWHSGAIPDSKGLRAQRYGSMNTIQKWVVDSLLRGSFCGSDGEWETKLYTSELFISYINHCDRGKVSEYHRFSECKTSSYLGKIFQAMKIGTKRLRGYQMDSLEESTKRFEQYEKVNISELVAG